MNPALLASWSGTLCLAFCGVTAVADTLPQFDSDLGADAWLREKSAFYQKMAKEVDARGGFKFKSTADYPQGVVIHENGQRYIALNDALRGAERVSILIYELTNAFQEPKHDEVDEEAQTGRITAPAEFSIRHELIEYDGLRLHRQVLVELERFLGELPAEMLRWINRDVTTLARYELPFAYDAIKAQEGGPHGRHYREWFEKQVEAGKRLGKRAPAEQTVRNSAEPAR